MLLHCGTERLRYCRLSFESGAFADVHASLARPPALPATVKGAEYPRAAYTEGRRVRVRGRGIRGSAYATRVRPRTALRALAAY